MPAEKSYEMQQGKNKILLFRRLLDRDKENAIKLVFQTEHTFSYSRPLDKILTKDGAVIKVGELDTNVSIEAIQAKDDALADMLRNSVIRGEKLELWEVTIEEDLKEGDKYPAIYAQGLLESWDTPAGAESEATISTTFQVEMEPQFGMATLTAEQQEAVQYAFRDTIVGEDPEVDPEGA